MALSIQFRSKLMNDNPVAVRLAANYCKGLEVIHAKQSMPQTLAVLLAANLNVLGESIPSDIIKKAAFDPVGLKDPANPTEDEIVLTELCKNDNGTSLNIQPTEIKVIGQFQLQFNMIRGFRPKRNATAVDVPLDKSFDEKAMNFNKMAPEERFAQETVDDITYDLYFNKYPFAPFHFLMVPQRTENHNQSLVQENGEAYLRTAYDLIRSDGRHSSIRIGYNALGAHASLNHFHFQGFLTTRHWQPPIDSAMTANGSWKMPAGAKFIEDSRYTVADAMTTIEGFHKNDINYNLYMSPQGIVIFPRKHQSEPEYIKILNRDGVSTGLAFFEMAGEVICPRREAFDAADESKVEDIYKAATIDV